VTWWALEIGVLALVTIVAIIVVRFFAFG